MKKTLLTAFFVTAVFAARAEAAEEDLEFRVFDVRRFTVKPADRPGPQPSASGRIAGPRDEDGFSGDFLDEEDSLSPETILEMFRSTHEGEESRAENSWFKVFNGRIFVKQPKKTIAALEAFLKELENFEPAPLAVRVIAFAPVADVGDGGLMDPGKGRELEARIRNAGAWREETVAAGSCGATFHAVKGRQFLFLSEFDVEVASESFVYDPVMETGETGLSVEVKAHPPVSAGGYRLDLRLSCAFPEGGDFPGEGPTSGGSINLPRMARASVFTTVNLRVGGYCLLRAGTSEDEGKGGKPAVNFLIQMVGSAGD